MIRLSIACLDNIIMIINIQINDIHLNTENMHVRKLQIICPKYFPKLRSQEI